MQDEILARLTAALADHYAVEDHVGAGGMAFVYRAQDIKHDRTVAIKVLQPELAASLGAERFLTEIKIAAKLTHPHILPLYDSGNADGLLFYVMPYVEGETLHDLLDREKQLGYKDALQFTKDVADALGYAHAHGVVHRDIKPDNIYITGGHAVVADFGIARAINNAGAEKLTQTGMAVGTPAYMSPEQAMGMGDIDGRSDIYSLGCVLYELVVGQIPFPGPTPQAVMARHSMDMVPRPHIMRDTVPDELEDAIIMAMAKSPADRFRTAHEFAEALDLIDVKNVTRAYAAQTAARLTATSATAVVTPSTPLPIPSLKRRRQRRLAAGTAAAAVIAVGGVLLGRNLLVQEPTSDTLGLDPRNVAVMYFEDLSPDRGLGHFADGLTEGLIDNLNRVRDLEVISRNGVGQYRDGGLSRDSIARALQVGSMIEGRIDQAGDKLRVTTILVDGNSGADYDRTTIEIPAGDFVAAEDSVVGEVSRLLRQRLGEEIRLQRTRSEVSSPEAWTLLLQGERALKDARAMIADDDPEGAWSALDRADSLLDDAETREGSWAAPIVLRAEVAGERLSLADNADEMAQWIDTGMGHADRALEADPDDADALAARGRLQYARWYTRSFASQSEGERVIQEARRDLQAAVEADPSNAHAHWVLSRVLYQTDGNFAAALEVRRAYDADAYLSYANEIVNLLFWTSYDIEQFGDARQWCNEGARRFRDDYRFVQCQLWLMANEGGTYDVDSAWSLYDRAIELTHEADRHDVGMETMAIVAAVIARTGDRDSADMTLVRVRRGREQTGAAQLDEAYVRVIMEDYDEAIFQVQRYLLANPDQDHGLEKDGQLYWWLRPLRDHPRFKELTTH